MNSVVDCQIDLQLGNCGFLWFCLKIFGWDLVPIGSMYAIYIYMISFTINIPQMYPNVSIYTIHGDPMGLIVSFWGGAKGAISYEQSPAGMRIEPNMRVFMLIEPAKFPMCFLKLFWTFDGGKLMCLIDFYSTVSESAWLLYSSAYSFGWLTINWSLQDIKAHEKTCHKNSPWKLAGNSLHTCGP